MSNPYFKRYDEFENNLIARFRSHPFFQAIHSISSGQFVAYLLQLSFLSLEFIRWEEIAKLGLTLEKAKEVVRHIVREEVPTDQPTHKDELLHDLNAIGVTTKRFRNVWRSFRTWLTIRRLYWLVRYPQPDYDLRVMVVLRVAGELLVAETYDVVSRELERRFNLKREDSRFYYPHWEHDRKGVAELESHADEFDAVLSQLIIDERTLSVAKQVAEQALAARYGFHTQFCGSYRTKTGLGLAAAGTAAGLACLIGFNWLSNIQTAAGQTRQRQSWQRFVASQPPAYQAFQLEADQHLLDQIKRSGNIADSEKLGTFESQKAAWGEGP